MREKTGSTDLKLGAHLLKLEEASYPAMGKKFVARKPVTLYRMTDTGRRLLVTHWKHARIQTISTDRSNHA